MFSCLEDRQPMIIAALIVSMIVIFYLYKENVKLKSMVAITKPPSILKKSSLKKVVITEPVESAVEVNDVTELESEE